MSRLTPVIKIPRLAGIVFCLFLFITVVSCMTLPPPPIDHYTLARAAIDAAKIVDAAKYSPGYFHKAEVSYRAAQKAYDNREYNEAMESFRLAKEFAEKAENSARLIRFKNGEVL